MRYILRRVGFYLIALWASITINFFIPRLIPGDPVSEMLSKSSINVTPAMKQALENMLGLPHTSIWAQYVAYLQGLLSGNLGISITHFPDTVTSVIATCLPWTLGLVSSVRTRHIATLRAADLGRRRLRMGESGLDKQSRGRY